MNTTHIALPFIGSITIARLGSGRFMRPLWIREEPGEVEINCGARLSIYFVSHGAEQRRRE